MKQSTTLIILACLLPVSASAEIQQQNCVIVDSGLGMTNGDTVTFEAPLMGNRGEANLFKLAAESEFPDELAQMYCRQKGFQGMKSFLTAGGKQAQGFAAVTGFGVYNCVFAKRGQFDSGASVITQITCQ